MTPRKTNSAPVDRWPGLGLTSLVGLDYVVVQYTAEWVGEAARRLSAGEPLGPMQHGVAMLLQHVSETPAALRAVNRYSERAPHLVYASNVAFHLLARQEIEGKRGRKSALAHVARAWGNIPVSSVEDCVTDSGAYARERLEDVVQSVSTRPGAASDRLEILRKLDAAMCHRAKSLECLRRRKRRKAHRKSR